MRVLSAISLVLLLTLPCGCRKEYVNNKNHPAQLPYIRRSNADTVIVFVHGVFGDANSTWTNSSTGAYWPELIKTDSSFGNPDVYVYSYSSPILGSASVIDELVEQMKLKLDSDEVFTKHKHVIFLCHSMGGLLVRKLLTRYQPLAAQVPLVYFFATPTTGAGIARVGQVYGLNPQIADMVPGEADHYVDILQRDWRAARFQTKSRCAYEEDLKIVKTESASMLCDGPVIPIEKNHFEIVKPSDKTDASYIAFRQAFSELKFGEDPNLSTTTTGGAKMTAVKVETRPITVACGGLANTTLEIPLPAPQMPGVRLVDAIVSIQQLSNVKQHSIQVAGRSESSVEVHYKLAGLDPTSDKCTNDGAGTIVVAFVLTLPVAPSSAPAQVRQSTNGTGSAAIYGVTGNVVIIRNDGLGTNPPNSPSFPTTNPLSLATIPQLQGILLDQQTRGNLAPAIGAVGGSVFIEDTTQPKGKPK